jgi:glycosyltransferase involved in cell wall biosynthesis
MPEPGAAPLVTVVVCLYNGERFLAQTVDSALCQTCRDFELIVVDDGSTDGSRAVLDRYPDPRLRVMRQPNRGAAGALCVGLQAAQGTYIALLDQDDLWEPDKLAAHVELMESRPEIGLTFSWFRVIDEAGLEIGIHSSRYRGTIDFGALLTDFVIGAASNVVVRRTAIDRAGGVDSSLPRMYDLDLCLRVARLASGSVASVPRDLMRYRRHAGQISRNLEAMRLEWSLVLDKMRCLAPHEVAQVEKRACSNMSRYFARLAYEDARYGAGLHLLREGFRHAPGAFVADRKNWLTGAACLSGLLAPAGLHRSFERLAGLRWSGRES